MGEAGQGIIKKLSPLTQKKKKKKNDALFSSCVLRDSDNITANIFRVLSSGKIK